MAAILHSFDSCHSTECSHFIETLRQTLSVREIIFHGIKEKKKNIYFVEVIEKVQIDFLHWSKTERK